MSYSKWFRDLLPYSSSSKHLSARGSSKHSSIHGSYSGGGKTQCDEGISLAILIATLAGIAVLAFTLYTKITMIERRRRETETVETSLVKLSNSLLFGTTRYFDTLLFTAQPHNSIFYILDRGFSTPHTRSNSVNTTARRVRCVK